MIFTFKPDNQQTTSVVEHYLRKHDFEEQMQWYNINPLDCIRIYHVDFGVDVDTTKKTFHWHRLSERAGMHVDYQCATLTKLVGFINPKGWDLVANAMDVLEQHFTKGNFYAENTKLRGSGANDIIVDDLY